MVAGSACTVSIPGTGSGHYRCSRATTATGVSSRPWRGGEAKTSRMRSPLSALSDMRYAARSEWREHPQGRAVAALPLLQYEDEAGTGTSRTATPARGARGATGFRVLDLTRVLAGPIATRTLAAWGAEVVRIDSPRLPEMPAHALDTLPGKRSAELDLAEPADTDRLEGLLATRRPSRPGLPARGPRPLRSRSARPGRAPPAPERGHAVRVGTRRPLGNPARVRFGGAVPDRDRCSPKGPRDSPARCRPRCSTTRRAISPPRPGSLRWPRSSGVRHPASVQLSLAQTARWLVDAGHVEPETPRRADVDAYRVVLPGRRRSGGRHTASGSLRRRATFLDLHHRSWC